jgi:ankyrin repeat protein
MSDFYKSISRLFLIAVLLQWHFVSFAQYNEPDSITNNLPIDTSEYMPEYLSGALDYNLMIASTRGYSSEVNRLISLGADINSMTSDGATPLIFAVSGKHLNTVNTLLSYKPEIDFLTLKDESPLLIAVKNNSFDIAESLIRAGGDPDYADSFMATPLNHACAYGFLEMADMLIYYGASVNRKSEEGTSPLLASVWAGHTELTDLLIQNGADTEAKNNDGFTPFLMAAYYGDTVSMDILFKNKADIYAVTNSKHNAITLSIISGNSGATDYLLRISNRWASMWDGTVNPYSVASKYRRNGVITILRDHKIPGQIKYGIDQMAISLSPRFGRNDFYSGLNFSFKEPLLNAGIIAGFDTKFWYTKVMEKKSEHLMYQYLDKSTIIYTGIFKDYALTDYIDKYNLTISTSIYGAYSFGNKLKGTLIGADNKLKLIPSVSLKYSKLNITFSAGLEYIKTPYYHNGPLWIRSGISYNLFFDKVRTRVKSIKWY